MSVEEKAVTKITSLEDENAHLREMNKLLTEELDKKDAALKAIREVVERIENK